MTTSGENHCFSCDQTFSLDFICCVRRSVKCCECGSIAGAGGVVVGGGSLQGVHSHANSGQGDAQSHGELHDGRGRERGGFALRLVHRLRCDSQHFLQVIKNLQEEAERGVAYTACIRNIHFLFLSVSMWIFFFSHSRNS